MNKIERLIKIILIIGLIVLAMVQTTYKSHIEPIKIWDEASSAQNAVEMLASGHYFVVHHDGEPTHKVDTKPPMNLWVKVISFKLFGINEFSVRFPSKVAILLTILLIVWFGIRYLKSYTFSIIAVFLIGMTPGYMGYHVGRHADPDALLMFFVASYVVLFFYILNEYPKVKPRYYVFLSLSVAFAVLTKSVAGLAPLFGIALFGFTQKKFYAMLKDYRFHLTWISSLVLFASYYLIREIVDPNYIRDSILREISKVNDYPGKPKQPQFSYYFDYLWRRGLGLLKYILPLVLFTPFIKNKLRRKLILYSAFGGLFFLLGNSSAVTKNPWYIASLYIYFWIAYSVLLVEFWRFIRSKINNKKISYTLVILMLFGSGYMYIKEFNRMIKINTGFERNVYLPEREGPFIDDVKEAFTEEKEFIVFSNKYMRQAKFYTKKHNYLDGSRFRTKRKVDSTFLNHYVICAQNHLKDTIENRFNYEVLLKGKYGKLYDLKSYK